MDHTATMTLTDHDGRRLVLDAAECEGFVNVLTEYAPTAVAALSSGTLDQATARGAGAVLYSAAVDVAERPDATVLITRDNGGTDPVVAYLARLAEHIGSDDLAARARSTLLEQAQAPVRPAEGRHYARLHRWADYLLTAAGPVAVNR